MADDDTERTESATGKRREEVRRQGRVFKSRELSSAAVFITALWILYFSVSSMFGGLIGINKKILMLTGTFEGGEATVHLLLIDVIKDMSVILMPFMIALLIVGVGANLMQVGFLFTTEPFAFDFNRLNPLSGLKKFVSLQALFELSKSMVKLIFVIYLCYLWSKDIVYELPLLIDKSVPEIAEYIGMVLWQISKPIMIFLGVIAAIDYFYQRYDYEKSIKMTKEEVKQEFKEQEGDPKVKARIMSIQRDLVRKRMLAAVPNATVVITNPTHIAVALTYSPDKSEAPVVVAKGAGFVAQKIKEIAKEHKVPMVEDKPLAWSLFKTVDIGRQIPETLYKAVAEIIAYVFKIKGKKLKK